jgi:hypothetical protein
VTHNLDKTGFLCRFSHQRLFAIRCAENPKAVRGLRTEASVIVGTSSVNAVLSCRVPDIHVDVINAPLTDRLYAMMQIGAGRGRHIHDLVDHVDTLAAELWRSAVLRG